MHRPGLLRAVVLFSLLAATHISLVQAAAARIDCYPEPDATQKACEARGCTWKQGTMSDPIGIPWCFMATEKIGYSGKQTSDGIFLLTKNQGPANPWDADFSSLTLTKKDLGNGVLNVRIEPPTKRYEPPLNLPRETILTSERLTFAADVTSDPFSFSVSRSDGRKLFDTSLGGLIFSDKFIQIASLLPSENMYGWGENTHQTLKHDFSRYTTWGMFARDEAPDSGILNTKNLYGVHPFYMMIEPDGRAHGVLIINSNAQEVTTFPGPGFVYRTIGGLLDIYFFPGPTPFEVTREYLAFIGKPTLPAYWSLGFQLCRWGYKSLDEMKTRVAAVRNYGIPIDVAYADIDYMERYKDFTIGNESWAAFPAYENEMHEWGMHLILIFDPGVEADYGSFQRALQKNATFIEWERTDQVPRIVQDKYPMAKDSKIMLGVVWPDAHVGFPDFLDPTNATNDWWTDEFSRFHDQIKYDGAWIDMNEPSSWGTNQKHPWYYDSADHPNDLPLSCPNSSADPDSAWDMPPFKTHNVYHFGKDAYLATNTLCMNAVTQRGAGRFYDTKSLYGWSESRATQQAVYAATGKRGVVISRSTFVSSGRYTGHWLGDNTARWEDLRTTVIGVQEFNLFGMPYVGSDVCGFNGISNMELCLRWQQLGAFHSFYRNHNSLGMPPQDPAIWPEVAAATKKANLFRYAYLPYLYSLHYLASLYGHTVVRPVFFEFPNDTTTLTLNEQFLWGRNILVAPALYPDQSTVSIYLPADDFFSLYDSNYGQKMRVGKTVYPAPTTSNAPTFVRGNSIIPRQTANMTTVATRLSPFNLLIVPGLGVSSGELFWDDGNSIVTSFASHDYHHSNFAFTVNANNARLQITTAHAGKAFPLPKLQWLEIFNYPTAPNYASFTLNGKKFDVDTQASSFNSFTKILIVYFKTPIDFSVASGDQVIAWTNGR